MIKKTFYSIFQKGSKTYFYSSLFFPTNIKQDVFELYAFVRKADNYVDSIPQDGIGFYDFKNKYYEAIDGEKTGDVVVDSFARLVKSKGFEHKWIDAFLDSMEMDLKNITYHSLQDTIEYIYGSAEVIGLMMAKIMNLPKKSYPHARILGRAMQYINFIRDIAEDIDLQRTYFPSSDFKKYGLEGLEYKEVLNKPDEFIAFIKHQIQRYCRWQNYAEKGFIYIPKRYLISVKTASEMYYWTASQINKNPFIVYEWKVKPLITQILTTTLKNIIDPSKPQLKPFLCQNTNPILNYCENIKI
jgi:phytoene synthase